MCYPKKPPRREGSEAQGERQNEQKVDTIWVGEGLGLRVGDRARLLIQDQEADYTLGGLLQGETQRSHRHGLGAGH